MPKGKVVGATGVAASSSDPALKVTAKDIETAMSEAATKAMEEGVSDMDEVRARMLDARKALKGPE